MTAPVTAGGNAISVVGDSTTTGADTGSDPTPPGEDPTDPTDPTTPSDPTTPTDPTPNGSGDTPAGDVNNGTGLDNPAASAVPALASATAASLAMTGGAPWQLLLLAGFLLLAGGGARITARRFADVR